MLALFKSLCSQDKSQLVRPKPFDLKGTVLIALALRGPSLSIADRHRGPRYGQLGALRTHSPLDIAPACAFRAAGDAQGGTLRGGYPGVLRLGGLGSCGGVPRSDQVPWVRSHRARVWREGNELCLGRRGPEHNSSSNRNENHQKAQDLDRAQHGIYPKGKRASGHPLGSSQLGPSVCP